MGWTRRRLRDAQVWARTVPDGELAVDQDGRVEIRYRDDEGAKVYRAFARNLTPDSGEAPEPPARPRPARSKPSVKREQAGMGLAPEAAGLAIEVWTDGACSGNPGPMGIGIVVRDGADRHEVSEYLGRGTNNIAELTAVDRALDELASRSAQARPIRMHVDSNYTIGVLARGFRAKANVELIGRIRRKLAGFAAVRFVKVEGHAGVDENERADELARQAVARLR